MPGGGAENLLAIAHWHVIFNSNEAARFYTTFQFPV